MQNIQTFLGPPRTARPFASVRRRFHVRHPAQPSHLRDGGAASERFTLTRRIRTTRLGRAQQARHIVTCQVELRDTIKPFCERQSTISQLTPDSCTFGLVLASRAVKERKTAEAALDRKEFWETFRSCLDKLPERVADVFMLREMEEMDTGQICEALRISQNNLWVMLHRARMALRECLELNWFQKKPRISGGTDERR
jgi:RNA polymerase sigma factor (sigma-70 family)